jgi:large subunit ribosomal protein L22
MGKPSAPRRVGDNEAEAVARQLRVSPRKLNAVAGLIRGKGCERALAELQFCHRHIAVDVRKALQSAIANAENNHQLDVDRLYIAEATVGKSLVMKRVTPRARGRAARIEKAFSNLRLVLRERTEETA